MKNLETELNQLKSQVVSRLSDNDNPSVSIFLKNWKRYSNSVQFLFRHVPDIREKTICDYGCGNPFMVFLLRGLGLNVIGIEPYLSDYEEASAETLGIREFVFKESSGKKFDLILLVDVIEHISVPKHFFEKISELTRQGTQIFISTPNVLRIDLYLKYLFRKTGHPNPISIFSSMDDNYTNHQREFTLQELNYLMRVNNYSLVFGEIINTYDKKEIRRHLGITKVSLKDSIMDKLKDFFVFLSPGRFANNIMCLYRLKNS